MWLKTMTSSAITSSCEYNGTHSWFLEYVAKCKSGEILIGHELTQMLDILRADMQDGRYRFNLAPAQKRIRFIETQCKHSISPWAGKPFLLELWEKALTETIYGFQMYDSESGQWIRRFTDVLLMIGRKNGKSTYGSGLGLGEFYCGPAGVNILVASNDYEQSSIVFDEINHMREESTALERVSRKNLRGIYMGNPKRPKTKGKFSYQNKAKIRKLSARTGAKEGRNVDFAIIDEVHEMKDSGLIMPIKQSMSTKLEPLLIQITTEGFTDDGYLDGVLKEARQVLAGELERPRWLVWLYTQDAETEVWQDERTWIKSNPSLGTIKRVGFLRGMVEEARTNTATRAFCLAKDFNIKQATAQAWLLPEIIDNPATFDLADLRGAIGLGGADLSETIDMTCAAATVMRPDNKTKYHIAHYFIPEAKIEQNEDKKDYLDWAKRGLLTVCPGNEIDYSMVAAWYVNLYRQHGIRLYKICMDRWGAAYLAKELEDYGFDCERVIFEKHNVSNPMKTLEADLRSKLLNYNGHEITRWCLNNTGVKVDNTGLIMPVKMQPNKRIDGTAATIMCYYGYNKYRTEYLQALR